MDGQDRLRAAKFDQLRDDILDIRGHIAEDSLEQADRWGDTLDEKLNLMSLGVECCRRNWNGC